MTVLSSLFSGISGLVANGSALSVIGDNISNVNTVGFKRGQANFENALTQKIGNAQIGLGARLSNVAVNFSPGSFETTGTDTDLAIDGKGFFVVKGTDGQFYTRAGNFFQNNEGKVINPAGFVLQGQEIDSTSGNPVGTTSDVTIASQTSEPVATTTITLKLNVDSDATVKAAFVGTSLQNAANSSNYSVGVPVYDSLGKSHAVTVYFNKTADRTWEYNALVDAGDLTNGTAGQTVIIKKGTLVFNTAGKLDTNTVTATAVPVPGGGPAAGGYYTTIPWKAAAAVAVGDFSIDFGPGVTAPTSGSGEITQYRQDFAITNQSVNGRPPGRVNSISFNEDGYLVGQFTNGETRRLYRISLATFASEQNLQRKGGNLFAETADSGQANINFANTGDKGKIQGGGLEMSNVDLATEFVKMVITQRGFQASARTISTTDQLLAELVQLGR